MSAAPVLYVVDSLGLSGKTKAMVDLIAGLDPARYRAHVVYFKPEESVLEGRLRGLGVEPQEVPCPDGLNARVVARLARVVRRLRPVVIHCYNPRPMLYGGLAARLCGVPGRGGHAERVRVPDARATTSLTCRRSCSRRRGATGCARASRAGSMGAVVAVSPRLGRAVLPVQRRRPRRGCAWSPTASISDRFERVDARADRGLPRARHACRPARWWSAASAASSSRRTTRPSCARSRWPRRACRRLLMLLVGDGPLRASLEDAGAHSWASPTRVRLHRPCRRGADGCCARSTSSCWRRSSSPTASRCSRPRRRGLPSSRRASTRCPRSWARAARPRWCRPRTRPRWRRRSCELAQEPRRAGRWARAPAPRPPRATACRAASTRTRRSTTRCAAGARNLRTRLASLDTRDVPTSPVKRRTGQCQQSAES